MLRLSHFCCIALSLAAMLPGRSAQAGKLTTLYAFTLDQFSDGLEPHSGLVFENGLLYGTTMYGAPPLCHDQSCGAIFSLDPLNGAFKSYGLEQKDEWPTTNLLSAGKYFFGTTSYAQHPTTYGVIFRVAANTRRTTVYKFSGGADGLESSALAEASGLLYGTSSTGGGPSSSGLLFSFDPKIRAKTTLHNFGASPDDGAAPVGRLTFYKGSLYGTTSAGGGSNSAGTIFKYDPGTGDYAVVASFQNSGDNAPVAGFASGGRYLYSVAHACSSGSLYRFDPATSDIKTLYVFAGGSNAANPNGTMIVEDSYLYGTSSPGGSSGLGTIFKVNKAPGAERILHRFSTGRHGHAPLAELLLLGGTFFGTTSLGRGHTRALSTRLRHGVFLCALSQSTK